MLKLKKIRPDGDREDVLVNPSHVSTVAPRHPNPGDRTATDGVRVVLVSGLEVHVEGTVDDLLAALSPPGATRAHRELVDASRQSGELLGQVRDGASG